MNKFWWLWLPLIVLIIQAGLETFLRPDILARLHSENGPHEIAQFLIMAAALIIAVSTLLKMNRAAQPLLAGWLGLAALCCLYVAGEEVSWGQHILDWTTPEFWATVNDQQETNLHNISSWLDQKPRLALKAGIIIGGLIIPFLMRYRPDLLPARFAVIYPPAILAVTAALAIGVEIIEETGKLFGLFLFERVSEVQELYMFYFVLLYLLVLKGRAAGTAPKTG